MTRAARFPSATRNVSCGRKGGLSKNATQPAGLFMSRLPTVSSVTGFRPVAIVSAACPAAATPSDSMSGLSASRLKTAEPLSPVRDRPGHAHPPARLLDLDVGDAPPRDDQRE